MRDINRGTTEERILEILQKTYPVTVDDLKRALHLSKPMIIRCLKKLQVKKIVKLDILPDKIYIRLLRNDFEFIHKKRQRKFIKRCNTNSKKRQETKDDPHDLMYH